MARNYRAFRERAGPQPIMVHCDGRPIGFVHFTRLCFPLKPQLFLLLPRPDFPVEFSCDCDVLLFARFDTPAFVFAMGLCHCVSHEDSRPVYPELSSQPPTLLRAHPPP